MEGRRYNSRLFAPETAREESFNLHVAGSLGSRMHPGESQGENNEWILLHKEEGTQKSLGHSQVDMPMTNDV